jgi:arylsulfatase A-like enzyme
MMGAHRLMEKGHLLHYEESVHIPLIISHPDGITGHDHQLHSMVDLTATLLELADLSAPVPIDGRGFADGSGRDRVFTETLLWGRDSENAHGEYRDPADFELGPDVINLSVRDHEYRYIFRSDDIEELYDQQTDPGEMTNLAGRRRDLVEQYRTVIAAEVDDVFPTVADLLRS